MQIPSDGFEVAALPADVAPDPDFEESVCLKGKDGKCGYLWQITTHFPAGNPAGTFEPGKEPRETRRKCLRDPSESLELNGLAIFTCNGHTDPEFRSEPRPFVLPPLEPEPEPEPKDPFANLPTVKMNEDPND